MNEVHLFKRGRVYWVRYWRNGREFRESTRTRSKAEALEYRRKTEDRIRAGRGHAGKRTPTLKALWDTYEAWASDNRRRPRTLERQRGSWNHLTAFLGEDTRADYVSRRDITDFMAHRRAEGNLETTINGHLRDIQAVYNRAIREGWYSEHNPVAGVDRYQTNYAPPECHSAAELQRLREAAAAIGRDIEWVILLGGYAGLRKREICFARWEWFEFNEAAPVIHVMAYPGFEIKDHEDRSMPMHRAIYDAMRPYAKPQGFVFHGGRTCEGKGHYRADFKKSLLQALTAAELPTEEPYQRLRETFGSLLVQGGASIFKVSRWMGHSSVKVTERHYVKLRVYDDDINVF